MTVKRKISLIGGDRGLEKLLRGVLPDDVGLSLLSSVIDIPEAVRVTELLLVAEVSAECSGLQLLEALNSRLQIPVWFLAADNSLRERAFALGVSEYFSLPLGQEFQQKLARLTTSPKVTAPLQGSGEAVSLFALLQLANSSQLTGVFQIRLRGTSGEIHLNDGQIRESTLGDLRGESALVRILQAAQDEFHFEFQRIPVPNEGSIERRTDHLLLTIASQLDEGSVGGL